MSLPISLLLTEEVIHNVNEPTTGQKLGVFIKFTSPSYPVRFSLKFKTQHAFYSILTEVIGSSITREELFRGVN